MRNTVGLCFVAVGLGAAGAARADVFQPGFHQALRISQTTAGRQTYRMKLPIGRAGSQLRVSFKAGDGDLTLWAASVAAAGKQGQLAGAPVALTFGGEAGFSASARARITSDPVPFAVTFQEELYVSFEVEGSLAASEMYGFPDSWVWSGSRTLEPAPTGGDLLPQAIAVDTVEVWGPPTRAFVAVGDSITEGYVSGDEDLFNGHWDDSRNAWPSVAQRQLQVPFNNAGVVGQGTQDAIAHLGDEVFTLQGITDCVVLVGTNDLTTTSPADLEANLQLLFDSLGPFCAVWAGTLLPKERTSLGDIDLANARRQEVNGWLLQNRTVAGVLDMAAALASPEEPNRFAQPEWTSDGIHPSITGAAVLGASVGNFFAAGPLPRARVRPAKRLSLQMQTGAR